MTLLPSAFIRSRWFKALSKLEIGTLHFTSPEGLTHIYHGKHAGPEAFFVVHDWRVLRRMVARGDIGLGEDYIAGNWTTPNIEQLFALFLLNMDYLHQFAHGNWVNRLVFRLYNAVLRRNNRTGSKSNIKAHYDVGNDFYRLWLDETMTYSSALFGEWSNLAQAQRAKYQRILDRIAKPGARILEIGCGWGGFAEHAANQGYGVTGLTVSPAQFEFAQKRLGDKAEIRLEDYRDVRGQFDAIVSIEMFEAVGEKYWRDYFNTIRERLIPGGKAVVQTITIRDDFFDDYRMGSDFIRHYVFPGGMLPSTATFKREAERAGLQCREVFAFGQDYARTLREWLTRFDAHRETILGMGHNEAFLRNWRFYLSICAAAFAIGRTNVIQVEITHAV
jgi:cyclopropane-fatty-acyl-phospholipid synthase